MKSPKLLITSLVLACASASHAALVVVENFDLMNTGAIGGQNGWTAGGTNPANSTVAIDPTNAANKVLSVQGATSATKVIPTIANGSTSTFFFRVYTDPANSGGGPDLGIGLTDLTPAGGGFGDFEVQSGVLGADPGFRARDGSSGTETVGPAMVNGVWYNVWMVVDNTNDNWRFYVQGGAFAGQTELLPVSGDTKWDFRNGTAANAITNFYVLATAGDANSKVYIDDLYVDTTGVNLINPVPEPGTALLGGLGLLALLRRRRA